MSNFEELSKEELLTMYRNYEELKKENSFLKLEA